MSSRALRRLQKEQFSPADQSNSDEESDGYEPPSKAQNLFDLLNEDGGSEAEGQEDSQDDEEQQAKLSTQPISKPQSAPSPPSTTSGSKSKKNKKNKKKQQKKAAKNVNQDISELSLQELDDMLDNLKTTETSGTTTDPSCATVNTDSNNPENILTQPSRQLISVNYRYLDSEAEMKRMFGSRVVNREARPSGRLLKKTKLAKPKVDWPSFQKQGLSMEQLDSADHGSTYNNFAFKHQEIYQDIQLDYLNVIAQHDPNGLVMLTHNHPYHVDSLLQLSEIAKQQGDWTVAGDCIDRALYASERAFHPHFNLGSGSVRLDYRRSENRSFFMTMVRNIQFLTRRGCWRTAFEFNKLLFSLSPFSDPTCALLAMDYYALSAREYLYVISFAKEWKPDGETYPKDILLLPNFAYSTAYAKFKHHQLTSTDGKHKVDSDTEDKDEDGSSMLCDAIAKFPGFVPSLLQALDESDATVNQHMSFFTKTKTDDYLSLLLALYIDRTHELWKEPEVLDWLKTKTHKVLKDSAYHNNAQSAIPRNDSDTSLPSNLCRHILLLERRELLSMLPRSATNATTFANDPLPPADSITGYDIDERMRTHRTSRRNGGQQGGILAMLQNLLGIARLDDTERQRIREAVDQLTAGNGIPGAFPGQEDDGDEDHEVTVTATVEDRDDEGADDATPDQENVDREEWQRILDWYGGSPSAPGDQRLQEILGHLGGASGVQQDESASSGDDRGHEDDYLSDEEDLELQRALAESAQQHHEETLRRNQQ